MLYVALGDSITYGYDATAPQAGYVQRIADGLPRKEAVHVFQQAKPGWTSRSLLKSLRKVPTCLWAEARLITLLVGGNDVLRAAPWLLNGRHQSVYHVAQRLQDNLEEMVQLTKEAGFSACMVIGTLYNPFPNSVLAESYVETVNQAILHVASRHRLAVADIRARFRHHEAEYIHGYKQGTLRNMRVIGNPIHPNDAGHAAIAHAFLQAYRRSTQPRRKRRRA
ncbi:spore germination lipase LipC [Alicyclobacillus contaminans]|uniref:SGNH/GDSL hydrolase family protein n=1 Tax=Alicyclobacillus contaminans TaxID=392016 RepID=UPI00040A9394|nr:SGNH/GDSL hydrolase family protein [Alicyclobacillus contaminans]GMA50420.1 spore germination lipase LipC [Alicyclobacillus contaminans]